jgi:hypothetical protein
MGKPLLYRYFFSNIPTSHLFYLFLKLVDCISGICSDSIIWNGAMDLFIARLAVLVHSFAFVAGTRRSILVPFGVCEGVVEIHW